MKGDRRQVRTAVDSNLLTHLQVGVSSATERAGLATRIEHAEADNVRQGGDQRRGASGQHADDRENRAWVKPASSGRQPRTTLSMPVSVAERARRLTMAITLEQVRDVSLGYALSRALDLLESELQARGAKIPETNVELRTGKRHV